jgi:hypothetical protein
MISAVILSPWFTPTAQAADGTTLDIRDVSSHQVLRPPPGAIEFSQAVAVEQVLQRLVKKPAGSFDASFAKRLGFDLPPTDIETAIQQARSSFPIAVFRIGLKRLQQFVPGDPVKGNPLELLAADANWLVKLPPPLPQDLFPARFLFPITVKDPTTGADVVKSSVRLQASYPSTLTPTTLNFTIERFGSSALIRQIDKWRRNPNPPRNINLEYFLVWIPALDRYYLGRMHKDGLRITAITNDPQVGLKEGKEDDAQKVFSKLKVEALTIDADDPDAQPR